MAGALMRCTTFVTLAYWLPYCIVKRPARRAKFTRRYARMHWLCVLNTGVNGDWPLPPPGYNVLPHQTPGWRSGGLCTATWRRSAVFFPHRPPLPCWTRISSVAAHAAYTLLLHHTYHLPPYGHGRDVPPGWTWRSDCHFCCLPPPQPASIPAPISGALPAFLHHVACRTPHAPGWRVAWDQVLHVSSLLHGRRYACLADNGRLNRTLTLLLQRGNNPAHAPRRTLSSKQ